jgi:protein-L-isoaspartate(D-aspartate) O-methyltransferase
VKARPRHPGDRAPLSKLMCACVAASSACTQAPSTHRDPPEARALRAELVVKLASHGHSARVLDAMRRVPRHLFVPGVSLGRAYADRPMPIGYDQTISQPTIVAVMSEALSLHGGERVLEIGTGSGYQAAVLSVQAREVYTIEIVPELAASARKRLADLGYTNVQVFTGDGYRGWPTQAPFDRIILTAAPPEVPAALFDQLAMGGVLVGPVGSSSFSQRLVRYTKAPAGFIVDELASVLFVPMVPAAD